jgi:septum formation protein
MPQKKTGKKSITEFLYRRPIMNKKMILASASPRRKEILGQIGMTFEVRKSNASEESNITEPSALVLALSESKAKAVYEELSLQEKQDSLVIGADTVVALEGEIMGKPRDEEDAVRMLSLLQGRTHQVYTGVALVYQKEGEKEPVIHSFFEKTEVAMYPMTEEEIRAYVATGEPRDKAGAYGIQGKCAAYIRGISGDYNNVVGLPAGRLYQELKKI